MKKKNFVKKDFSSHMNKYIDSIQTDGSVEDYWNILKGALLEGTDWSYGWKKGPVRHKKYAGGMMLVIVYVSTLNYGKSGNRKIQV